MRRAGVGAESGGEVASGGVAGDGDAGWIDTERVGMGAHVAQGGAAIGDTVGDGDGAGFGEAVGDIKGDETAHGRVAGERHEALGGAAYPGPAVDPENGGANLTRRGTGRAKSVQYQALARTVRINDVLGRSAAHQLG